MKIKYSESTIVPAMTSNTAPSGLAFASNEYTTSNGAYKAFNQFDDSDSNVYMTSTNYQAGHIGYRFSKREAIGKYAIRSSSTTTNLNRMPKNWTFEGSNDTTNGSDGTWTVLDTQSNQTWSAIYTDKEYLVSSPQYYNAYRIKWTANNGNTVFTSINEIKLYTVVYSSKFLILSEDAIVTVIDDGIKLLPSNLESIYINHGMSKNLVIDLNASRHKVQLVKTTSETIGSGKIFKQEIDTAKIPIKKASIT